MYIANALGLDAYGVSCIQVPYPDDAKRELREQKRQAKLERKMQDEKEGKKKGIKLPSLKGIFGGGGGQPQ